MQQQLSIHIFIYPTQIELKMQDKRYWMVEKIKCFKKLFLMISLYILLSNCATVSPVSLATSSLFQIGSYSLSSAEISANYTPWTAASVTKNYAITIINSYPNGFNCGFGFKKLAWDYKDFYNTELQLLPILSTSSVTLTIRVDNGDTLLKLETSYILIDSSLTNNFYCKKFTPSFTPGAFSSGNSLNLSVSHTFTGYSSQTIASTYISRMILKANDSSQYVVLQPIIVTSINSSTFFLDLAFQTNIAYFGSLELHVLFINPITIRQSYVNAYTIQSPISNNFIGTPYTQSLYTDGTLCNGVNDFFIGINGWTERDVLNYQIVTNSMNSNITVFGFSTSATFYTTVSKACEIQCSNPTFPYLYPHDLLCYDVCPIGTVPNITTLICLNCITNCSSCQSMQITNCTSCFNGTFLHDFDCLVTCPNKTYGDINNHQCIACDPFCQVCHNSSSNCSSCISGKYLMITTCQNNCSVGSYPNSSNVCIMCLSDCAQCTSVVTCNTCYPNYYLSPNFTECLSNCPVNYFPNQTTGACQSINILGCASSLYFNNIASCLRCDASNFFIFNSLTKTCICKIGYKLSSGLCNQVCGDGIVDNFACDDGNLINGDGCSQICTIQNDFTCQSIANGPSLTSQCTYLANIGIKILSQTKVDGENTMKLILKISPSPGALSVAQIKNFLNIKIANQTINMSNIQILCQNGIAQIYVPYGHSIQGQKLNLWTSFDPKKYTSANLQISSLLQGDNVALLYSDSWQLYKNLSTFSFSMTIFVCIIAIISFWKHKMIGLQLILPFQVIFYSQTFYSNKSYTSPLYTAFKPVSFSIFTPNEVDSKNNTLYNIGMVGGFLENYNILGVLLIVSGICLILSVFKVHIEEFKRFKNKKKLNDWIKFPEFRRLLQNYETIVWKGFFVSLCLSTIPLIFAIPSAALTQINNFQPSSTFDIFSQRLSNYFILLFIFGLFYTSIPNLFYNNNKSFLKKYIIKQECQKFKYDAKYCVYFQLHYLAIGCILAFFEPSLTILCILSSINAIFFLYLIIQRPYQSKLDNFGAILSNFITFFFLNMNLIENVTDSSLNQAFLQFETIFIILLLLLQIVIGFIRFIIFYKLDRTKRQKSLGIYKDKDFNYVRDDAFKRFTNEPNEQQEINQLMKQLQPSYKKTIFSGLQKQKNKQKQKKNKFIESIYNKGQQRIGGQKQRAKVKIQTQNSKQNYKQSKQRMRKEIENNQMPSRKQVQQRLRKNLMQSMIQTEYE